MTGASLIGRIAARRVETIVARERGSRAMFAIVDLGSEPTTAIARAVAAIGVVGGRIQVAIHPSLAASGLPADMISDDVATRFRNNKASGVVATVFSVPGSDMELVLQSLDNVERINEAWLLERRHLRLWVRLGLPDADASTADHFLTILRGLVDADVLASVDMLGDFVDEVHRLMTGSAGLALANAVNHALPVLRLPRDSLAATAPDVFAKSFETQIRRVAETTRSHFHLVNRKGEYRPVSEMRERIGRLADEGLLERDSAEALLALVEDRSISSGRWTPAQEALSRIPWSKLRPFFEEAKTKPRANLGAETTAYFEAHHPRSLTKRDAEILSELTNETSGPNEDREDLFVRHRELLRGAPKLYKRWERLVFDKPVESDELLRGLVLLAARAFREVDDERLSTGRHVLLVRLRGAEREGFWRTEKNTNLCRLLRDRYRGLDELLAPHVELRLGRCWTNDWEQLVPDGIRNEKGARAAEFDFEAFVVPAEIAADGRDPADAELRRFPKAQMTWKPHARGFSTAFADDLRDLVRLPASAGSEGGEAIAFLLRSEIAQARHGKSGALQAVDLRLVETVTDARGSSRGTLTDPDRAEFRIDDMFATALAELEAQVVVSVQGAAEIRAAFDAFRSAYSQALAGFARRGGSGLSGTALLEQIHRYGELLRTLHRQAPQEVSVARLWSPLLQIGTALVSGERDAVIVAPWHPLRLAEIGAKARQAADVIARVVERASEEAADLEDYVKDRVQAFGSTYYADVGVALSGSRRTVVVETTRVDDYGLLEPVSSDGRHALADEPAGDTVKAFGRIAKQYLDLRPHERANFSAVLLDAESEELPVLMANHLARQIEGEPDLRCDLVVTHENPVKLRAIYERQNRRIGHEIESSLTSEAARTFLSRLRVGIMNPGAVGVGGSEAKQSDIVLMQDVIARQAAIAWALVDAPTTEPDLATHVPTDFSRRRPYNKGNMRAGVYLSASAQPLPCRSYLDTVHDVFEGRALNADKHRVPMQEVDFKSDEVVRKLEQAHRLGNWVITYDRIADRRLVASTDNLRILRYFSPPRSVHNVIVSTEVSRASLRERLRSDLLQFMPSVDDETITLLVDSIHRRSASLSGGIVMRGAQWDNYAKELIGVVVAQRQLELAFRRAGGGPSRTAWFFLDDFKGWLDLSGEIADILAVDLLHGADGPRLRIAVVEAKCVADSNLQEMKARSLRQLEATYAALANRFVAVDSMVDPAIWRNRLADMLLEHIDPFDHVGSISYDEWIDGIRRGRFPVELSGHSIAVAHDVPFEPDARTPNVPDEAKPRDDRRRIAQWTFGRDVIARTMAKLDAADADGFLFEPALWPSSTTSATSAPAPTPAVPAVASSPDAGPRGSAEQPTADRPLEPTDPKPEASHPAEEARAPNDEPVGRDVAAILGSVDGPPAASAAVPRGWLPEVHAAIASMGTSTRSSDEGEAWLEAEVANFRRALQAEGLNAAVKDARLTPNSGLVVLDGSAVSYSWLEKKQTDLKTRYHVEIIRITAMLGRIAVAIKRPRRSVLHLSEAWRRRRLGDGAPRTNFVPVLGEKEEDGSLFYLPLTAPFLDQERAAPHTIVSGTTGSGKGILATSLILDLCAFNSPDILELHLIDPKRGVDYAWVKRLPHLRGGIVDDKDAAVDLLRSLVLEMESRYDLLQRSECANIDQYNRSPAGVAEPMKRVFVFFDEVANWMQDDEFKDVVEPVLNEIATKSRAAGLHLIMIYQRADNQVMTMQLRTNLGNKLVLRLSDEGSSRIVLNEKGAEKLLGKGHLIAVLDSGDRIYGQVPFIDEDDVRILATAIVRGWTAKGYGVRIGSGSAAAE